METQINSDDIKYLLISTLRSSGNLIVNKELIKKLGGINHAIILSHYLEKQLYWEQKNEGSDGWFYCTHKSIMDSLLLTEYAVKTSKKLLIKLGILTTKMDGLPAKEWLCINYTRLYMLMVGAQIVKPDDQAPSEINTPDPQKIEGLYPQKTEGPLKEKETREKRKQEKKIKQRKRRMMMRTRESENETLFSLEENTYSPNDKIVSGQFDSFWVLYPKKTDKGAAKKAWEKLCTKKDRPSIAQIAQAVASQNNSQRWKEGFIKYPATWLNNYGWLDTANEMASPAANTPKQKNKVGYRNGTLTYKKADKI